MVLGHGQVRWAAAARLLPMRRIFFFFIIAAVAACRPEPDSMKLYDQLVVTTSFDPTADFANYHTYAITSDTVGYVSENSSDTILTSSKSDFPRPTLQAVEFNMNERGFTRVGKNESPDLGVNVVVVEDFNVFQRVVYPDPYYYPGSFYSNYYGYNSWYYYPYVNTYAYNTGVLIIELVDLKNRTPDNKVRVVWSAYMGDLYSTINLVDQTEQGIDQAFKQSTYISTTGL
jgi:hypothetical protein